MIKCSKCNTPVIREPNGVLRMACDCWPPRLYQHGGIGAFTYTTTVIGEATAIPAESFTISSPEWITATPDGLQYCENCGAPMLQSEHKCHKVEPVTNDALKPKQRDDLTPAMAERMDIMREDAKIEAEAEYKQAMQKCIEHLKTCSTCKYLSQVDGSTCPDMVKLRAMRDIRLLEEVEVQK